ncbi:hypothetical protein G3O01_09285 [Burkholderia sp. Ac-20365]|nr:hypothetical protein [Burkholderia sp. Ac-20365]
MNIGIIPGWIIAALLAINLADVPVDISLAVAAVGMNASMYAVSRQPSTFSAAALPVVALMLRYIVAPAIAASGQGVTGWQFRTIEIIGSADAVCAFSVLAMLVAMLMGFVWVHHGSGVSGGERKRNR